MLPNKLLAPGAHHLPGLSEPGGGCSGGTTTFWMKDYNGFISAGSGHFSMAWGSSAKEYSLWHYLKLVNLNLNLCHWSCNYEYEFHMNVLENSKLSHNYRLDMPVMHIVILKLGDTGWKYGSLCVLWNNWWLLKGVIELHHHWLR